MGEKRTAAMEGEAVGPEEHPRRKKKGALLFQLSRCGNKRSAHGQTRRKEKKEAPA